VAGKVKHREFEVDLIGTETKEPKFLNINPAGTVPVLVHNGHPIYESHEQILYINKVITIN
jgi:glutathione S-transferase